MMNIILYESHEQHNDLLPLSYTRPIAYFRIGILTIREKWQMLMQASVSCLPDESLIDIYEPQFADDNIFINAAILPTEELSEVVSAILPGQALTYKGAIVAARGSRSQWEDGQWDVAEVRIDISQIKYVFDIFLGAGQEIKNDYALITHGRESQPLSKTNLVIGPAEDAAGHPLIFLEKGAKAEGAIFNTAGGPIYIGEEAEICEGACIRGSFALGGHARVNMGAKIYSDTCIGPYCKVGGELNNAVIFGYSNKAHDGYLGNAVIGEWCNIGAGVNASNLKNDYSKIRVWNYPRRSFMRTDLQFCGLIMGDHSKIGISVMLNTATVIGVGVNLHGSGYPRAFIPSFLQGSPTAGFTNLPFEKFIQTARTVMSRRGIELTDRDEALFRHVERIASEYK